MLLSGIGKPYDPATGAGHVGKNYAYQITSSVNVFYDDKFINPFIGAGALGMIIDDYQRRQLRPRGTGLHRRRLYRRGQHRRAADRDPSDARTGRPNWGAEWKQAVADNYLKTSASPPTAR